MAFPSADFSGVGPTNLSQFGQFTMPAPNTGGMFGGGKVQIQPGNAIAGYLAGRFPQYASSFLAPTMAREQLNREAQLAMLQNNLEFQRQMQLAQFQAQLGQQYPTDPLSVALRQAGVMPGTPAWQQAQATQASNLQNPVVNAGMYGPVLRSQVDAAGQAPTAPVGQLRPYNPGGPTQPASGGFPY